ncbi:phosphate/phosphite/phosphonate ABC transporter substrate-binding protein [Desulfurivibrio sp. D14AmB]|uniref:phosphate/phosphite/phosphonate ABC transporter substrate-binding protein n=1 Tax=Desulfurivibrio sp. D14AmB TaxID=3374370 RepID=UPI00376F2D18
MADQKIQRGACMYGKIKSLLVAILVLAFLASPLAAAESYVFGSHPFKNPAELAGVFRPMISLLEEATGAKISFRSARDYEAFSQAVVAGEIDIFFMGPSLFAEIHAQHPDKIRLVATAKDQGKPTFNGVIVARKDSGINTLADLKGKKFAFGDRSSTLSAYLPAVMLMEAGVFDSLQQYDFTGRHDNVANSVLQGRHDAGGLKPDVAAKYLDQGLKVIAESEPVYEHVIAVGPKVDAATLKKIQDALVGAKDPAVYTSINAGYTGFAVTRAEDYARLLEIMKKVDAKIAQ